MRSHFVSNPLFVGFVLAASAMSVGCGSATENASEATGTDTTDVNAPKYKIVIASPSQDAHVSGVVTIDGTARGFDEVAVLASNGTRLTRVTPSASGAFAASIDTSKLAVGAEKLSVTGTGGTWSRVESNTATLTLEVARAASAPVDAGASTPPEDAGTTAPPADAGSTTKPADAGTAAPPVDAGSTTITPSAEVLSFIAKPSLIFDQEFDTLDYSNTTIVGHTWWNGVPAWIPNAAADSFSVADGILTISSTKDSSGNWTQPNLSSDDGSGKGFFFGTNTFIEIRAKMNGGGSFWSMPYNYSVHNVTVEASNPETWYCEHDWYESTLGYGGVIVTTMHENTSGYGGLADQINQSWPLLDGAKNYIGDWHTYGFWRPANSGAVEIFIDGVKEGTAAVFQGNDQPLMLIISAYPTDYMGGTVTDPAVVTQQIDYLRIYQ